ncbi:MAG TPA: electron transport complex subunit RsxC [Thauera sp.]|uniref:electron transport complex subunit RsxC n=1 Tax=Thauera sp. TaxID=1905334 RepID=UPI002C9723C8|nr:electron transport complex subunit RsxC [Thauera sp.]HRP24985.1 electron transport complex subunit RsxC [Thauera sp.]HRP65033.1 electron transport complex subunit RsxC [Thauera sp.]
MIGRLFKFHGGIKPAAHKDESASAPIRRAPLPSRLIVPLRQSTRATATCIVEVGQKVLKGQRIGEPEGLLGTAVHAPTSGTVVDFGPYTMAHASGLRTRCVVIEPDGEERWIEHAPFDYHGTSREESLAWLRECGIVGLGGASFPSHVKLGKGAGIETLILNGGECEPWITCDDRLMRERAADILAGAVILRELIGAREMVVGIEDNKPEAIAAMQEAAAASGHGVRIVPIPSLYPAGGEKQLIRVLTGIEIPYGKLGADFGVQCFNVGTAHAVYRAIAHGEPLLSRIVTLTGNVEDAGNWEVLIGTPIEELLPLARPKPDTDRRIMGGPMMGFALPRLDVPIVKGSNCIIAASPKLFPPPPPEQPCIRCTECAKACPAELQPFELYWFGRSKNFGKAQEYHLFDCIECGCCAYVCPSHIPLVDYFRFSKSEIWARERDKAAADQARERFEFRNFRQEREKAEKAAKLAAKAAETRAKLAEAGSDAAAAEPAPAAEDPKKALIAAALARAKAQKAEVKPQNTDNLSPETQAEIADIEARRKALAGADGVAAPRTDAGPAAAAAADEPRP